MAIAEHNLWLQFGLSKMELEVNLKFHNMVLLWMLLCIKIVYIRLIGMGSDSIAVNGLRKWGGEN